VAQREFASLRQLLPSVLARVARDSGSARPLRPIWEEAVGGTIARNAWPVSLKDGVLTVGVSSEAWARALAQREAELVGRLSERLGGGVVCRLAFRLGP
jgi:predicted nucleic acid-binding Zn ribbon protein